MNATYSQSARRGRLTTVLGQDALVLLRLNGDEVLSGDFEWRIEALSGKSDVDLEGLLGTHATVAVDTASGTRHFDGIVTEVRHCGAMENGWRYDLVLRPWLHLAELRHNFRIFHQMTVIQIVKEVLQAYSGVGDDHFEVQVQQDYPVLEYTVQYNESDADFVRRQLERFGICWTFTHGDGRHTLWVTDATDMLPQIPGGARPYFGVAQAHHAQEEHFRSWTGGMQVTTGAARLTEYNFKTPNAVQEVDRIGDAAHVHGDIESYEWPGDYLDQSEGRTAVGRRLDAKRSRARRHRAEGDIVGMGAGVRVTVSGQDIPGVTGQRFVCLSATHRYSSHAYGSVIEREGDRDYDGSYVLMPQGAPLAPEPRTQAPRVHGPETAFVVGDGEIDCDEHGRILVRFHWDLARADTMRVRVSQNWASRGWGGMVIPRIGMEVIVEHLRGDPDKPIVTGCVYNGLNRPPAELPANKSRSVFKTKSHQGEGFNELTFEDQSGEEFIYMHAQKNLDIHVENSAKRRVEFDDNVSIGNASNLDVAADRTETIEGKLDVKVTGPIAEKTDADRGADVGGSYAIKTGGDLTIKAAGEIVLDATKITLVSGGAALVVQGGAVNVAPMLNVGSASPGAAAIPAIPAVLEAAAGAGSPFVSHCPMKDGGE